MLQCLARVWLAVRYHEINMSKHCTYCGRPRGAGEASRVVPIPVSFEGLRFLDDVFLP